MYGRNLRVDSLTLATSLLLCTAFASVLGLRARGESPSDKNCDDPDARGSFIAKSLELVNSGSDRGRILGTLTCIARAEDTTGYVGIQAVGAIFHIAQQNRVIQEYLLRIIRDDGAGATTRLIACEFLVYVADETGRQELLHQLKRRWPRRASGELSALIELGDPGVLCWLEETATATENDRLRAYLETRAEWVRVQESTERLLATVESDGGTHDRGWIVRQAMRHGATREAIRNAVLAYLRRIERTRGENLRESPLLAACEECGIFKDRDMDEFPAIRAFRETRKYIAEEPVIHEWATLISTKRAQFYGLNR